MNSRRALIIICLVLIAMAAFFSAASFAVSRFCQRQMAANADDLEWLRREFRLNDAEMQRVRVLHQGYLPKCRETCARIAEKKAELQAALEAGGGVTPEAEKKLAEVAALRTQCQTQMLRHFKDVSQAMPPEQGRRYLSEMQRLTLGTHEQIERDMSSDTPHHHGHH